LLIPRLFSSFFFLTNREIELGKLGNLPWKKVIFGIKKLQN
jgi:hypothetical protein